LEIRRSLGSGMVMISRRAIENAAMGVNAIA
jgi:hypothetical protein